jgi:putative ABC transport system ATP-binding protein
MAVIETRELWKTYGQGDTAVHAIRDVSLRVNDGEFVAVVGPSGSGKSTLLHLLGGLDRPSSGTVVVEDRDIFALGEKRLAVFRRRKIGFVFQFFNLVPVITAEENILLPYALDRKPPDREHVGRLVSILGLADRLRHYPGQLSGGQQQRVALARALAYRPAIVLADEPTGNLDRAAGRDVMELLRHMCRTLGQTVMVITHDPETASCADRVVRIEDGRLAMDSSSGGGAP